MNIGIFPSHDLLVDKLDWLRCVGRVVDDRGFHSLWLPEHVAMFEVISSQSPYRKEALVAQDGLGTMDPLSCLAFLAAMTSHVRLGTGICVLPQRQPLFLAKEATTIDILSGGRLDLGLGVGWVREEFQAVGAPFEERGSVADSYLQIMKTLWVDATSSFDDGGPYTLPACQQYPKPVQSPHIPVHIGGNSKSALRRVARFGQGWYAFNLDPDGLRDHLHLLDQLLDEEGRRRGDIAVSVCGFLRPTEIDDINRYREAGADQVILFVGDLGATDTERRINELADRIVEPAREL
jgi:probable F420-dependent oxidoreductase